MSSVASIPPRDPGYTERAMQKPDPDVDAGWDEAPDTPHDEDADAARERYLAEGYTPSAYGAVFEAEVEQLAPGSSTALAFYEKDGHVFPRGFVTTTALATLKSSLSYLDFREVKATLPAKPRRAPSPGDLPRDVKIADKVDLRAHCSPVSDQGHTARSLAFAWTHALEMCARILDKPSPCLSTSFTMLQFQRATGASEDFERAFFGESGGTSEMGHVLFDRGTCRLELWPDDEARPRASLDEMLRDAKDHALRAALVDVEVDELKKALSGGFPVIVTMTTTDPFVRVGRDGVCRGASKATHGAHAMLCVGYVDDRFILKSSWGTGWGDLGFCYAPAELIAASDPELTAVVFDRNAAWTTCPQCAVKTPSAVYCTSCGLRLAKPSFCSECGAPLEGTNACAKCGTTTA
jgi:hypothetical protein